MSDAIGLEAREYEREVVLRILLTRYPDELSLEELRRRLGLQLGVRCRRARYCFTSTTCSKADILSAGRCVTLRFARLLKKASICWTGAFRATLESGCRHR